MSIISKLIMIAIFVMTIIVRKRIHDIAHDTEETADTMESEEYAQTVNEPVIIPDHSQDEQATTLLSADSSVSSLKQESVKPSVVNKSGTIRSLNSVDGEFAYPVNDGEELVIGKDASVSSIIVGNEYDTVSRKHCGIMYVAAEDNYRVIDYSTNGTYLNGKKMDKGVYQVVAKGAVLSIANDKIRYRLV